MPFTNEENLLLSCFLPTAASQARLAELAPQIKGWTQLVARAETLLLSPLLRAQLANVGTLDTLPMAERERLEQGHQVWAARHLAYVSEARRLLAAFAEANVQAMPLKGAALLLLDVYPQTGWRPALDIDVLIEPNVITKAEQVAEACGYAVMPGRTAARPHQRLANELNHAAPRRGPSGVILELHTRAFRIVQQERDIGWPEFAANATVKESVWSPALADIALHLLHHTMVDWQSTKAILRTLADLHFLFAKNEGVRAKFTEHAQLFGLQNTAALAQQTLALLAESTSAELEAALAQNPSARLLLETALLPDARAVADAARLFEYFDFSRQPFERLRSLAALLFTNRAHLEQLYGNETNVAQSYARRPFDLLRKFNWASLNIETLSRVRRLRRIIHQAGDGG
jgi:Uncharacterised nucleotidyltransferase